MRHAAVKERPLSAVDRGIPAVVVRVLEEVFGVDDAEITLDSRLVDDFLADELDIAEMSLLFEDAFPGLVVPDRCVDTWYADTGTVALVIADLRKAGASL